MKCTILGCGGSLGVPQLGCECFVCTSVKKKNNRTRCSILIEDADTSLLIDTSSDFRQQAFKNNIKKVDSVIFTHAHADHFSGIDDFKPIAMRNKGLTNAYLNQATYDGICGSYRYLFKTDSTVYRPVLHANIIDDFSEFEVGTLKVQTFRQSHGECDSLGIRIDNFVYSTDFNDLPQRSLDIIKGADIWVIDCLRYMWAPTHNYYETTLNWIEQIKPKRAIFTHMAHDVDFDELAAMLPEGVVPAYDGMVIKF